MTIHRQEEDNLLETDAVLKELMQELSRFKSASERLAIADGNVSDLIPIIERLVDETWELASQSRKQLHAVQRLADGIEDRLASIVEQNQSAVSSLESRLRSLENLMRSDVVPALNDNTQAVIDLEDNVETTVNSELRPSNDRTHALLRSNHRLLVLTLLLVILSLVPWIYLLYVGVTA